MKRSREVLLWTFFLAVCFWAGYLKGFLPLTFKHSLFVKGAVRIYNAAPFDFPRNAIAGLEEDLGQRVEVVKVRNWDDLQAKLVTKTGAHLLFAPTHWTEDLSRENVIVGLSYIQTRLDKYIAADFISLEGKGSLAAPLYWTVTQFVSDQDSFPGMNLAQALADKSLADVHLYPDQDTAAVHLKKWNSKLKDFEGFNFRFPPKNIEKNTIWEVPSLTQIPHSKNLETNSDQVLLTYGLMIPKNSPNRRVSYKTIERMLEPGFQNLVLAGLPLGTTLKDENKDLQIEKEQRSAVIRDLKLHELVLLNKRHIKEFQELQMQHNFVF